MIDKRRIKNIANRIIFKYNLKVPIDLNLIVKDYCKYIETDNINEADGYTDLSTIPPTMYINNTIRYNPRVRFTIAHELGHILIPWHNGTTTYVDSKLRTKSLLDKNEAEADAFASELLLPTDWLKNQIGKYSDMQSLILNVMQESNTSFIATLRAIVKCMQQPMMFYYSLSEWDYWQVLATNSFDTFGCWVRESNNAHELFKLIDYCKDSEYIFDVNSYEVMCKQMISIPENLFDFNDSNFELLLNELSLGQPLKAVPFIDYIINNISNDYIVLIKLKDYKMRLICSKNIKQTIYPNNEDFFDFRNRLLNVYYSCENGDMDFGAIGDLFWLKLDKITIPNCDYSDPNTLLSEMIGEIYDSAMFDIIWRKANGVLGGSNNVKNKNNTEEFFELLFDRFRLKKELLPLTKHYKFKEFLINKIKQMNM